MPNYNSNQVSISMGGITLSGFGDDSMVSIEWDTDIVTDTVGVDGEVTASKLYDYRATATVMLKESSASNAILAGFYEARRLGDDAIGVVPFSMEDGISGERVIAAEAWVMKAPTTEKGKEASDREWTIRLADAQYAHTAGVF